jgi:hypothetical protein
LSGDAKLGAEAARALDRAAAILRALPGTSSREVS